MPQAVQPLLIMYYKIYKVNPPAGGEKTSGSGLPLLATTYYRVNECHEKLSEAKPFMSE